MKEIDTNIERLVRYKLNSILPFYDIVRYPETSRINDIPINYWLNSYSLSIYIRNKLRNFIKKDIKEVDRCKYLNKHEFLKHIMNCHKLLSLGNKGLTPYARNNNILRMTDIGRIRISDHNSFISISTLNIHTIINTAIKYNDPIADILDREQCYIIRLNSHNIKKNEFINHLDVDRAYFENPFDVPLLIHNKNEYVIRIYYVSCKYIKKYIEKMRLALVEILLKCHRINNNVFSNDKKAIGNSNCNIFNIDINNACIMEKIAEYYQAGIHAQVVKHSWNSLLQIYIRELLLLNNITRMNVGHGMDDLFALILKKDTFRNYYCDKYLYEK
jgi:hypothetical protein